MNKKNILLLTTIYPAPDLTGPTKTIHYFTREWVNIGYNVKVIHFQAVYPGFFYVLAKLIKGKIASITGSIVYTKKDKKAKHYSMEGVSIARLPVFKWIPHGKFTPKSISLNINTILTLLKTENYNPDFIIGHFSNPQLQVIYELKKHYNSNTCLIMHDNGNTIKKIYPKSYKLYFECIDSWGFRSNAIKKGFESNYGIQKNSFMCYSGIPDIFLLNTKIKKLNPPIKTFVYVGEMIKRKFPAALIKALSIAYKNKNFELIYIGEGGEKDNLLKLSKRLGLENQVDFAGRLPREKIIEILDNSDCMIMISKGEAFGLAYLEAMARGCLTIGSFNEGIDGIIIDKKNGFLCHAGDHIELANLITNINSMSIEELYTISERAKKTAENLTDKLTAESYINSIDVK